MGYHKAFDIVSTFLKALRSYWRAPNKDLLLDNISEGILVVDRTLAILEANQKIAQMFGKLQMTLLGPFFTSEPFPSPLVQHCKEILQRCLKTQRTVDTTLALGECMPHYFQVRAVPMKEGGALLILHDESDHYRVLKMGRDFVANASHELRTPITIVKGFTETLRDMSQISDVILEEIIQKILKSCERMEQLIQSLLILADLDYSPHMQKKKCNLIAVLDHTIATLKAAHPTVQITSIYNEEEVSIPGDGDLLELAILNLLQNAVKYSPEPAHVTIKVEEILNEVRLSIADKGLGIPEKDLPHIFERFYTVDKARSRRLGGAGLGLSIVKAIIEKHQGTVNVYSKVDEGTEFILTLPRS